MKRSIAERNGGQVMAAIRFGWDVLGAIGLIILGSTLIWGALGGGGCS